MVAVLRFNASRTTGKNRKIDFTAEAQRRREGRSSGAFTSEPFSHELNRGFTVGKSAFELFVFDNGQDLLEGRAGGKSQPNQILSGDQWLRSNIVLGP